MHANPGFDLVFGNEDDMWGSPGVVRSDAQGLYVWESLVGWARGERGGVGEVVLTARRAECSGSSPYASADGPGT